MLGSLETVWDVHQDPRPVFHPNFRSLTSCGSVKPLRKPFVQAFQAESCKLLAAPGMTLMVCLHNFWWICGMIPSHTEFNIQTDWNRLKHILRLELVRFPVTTSVCSPPPPGPPAHDTIVSWCPDLLEGYTSGYPNGDTKTLEIWQLQLQNPTSQLILIQYVPVYITFFHSEFYCRPKIIDLTWSCYICPRS